MPHSMELFRPAPYGMRPSCCSSCSIGLVGDGVVDDGSVSCDLFFDPVRPRRPLHSHKRPPIARRRGVLPTPRCVQQALCEAQLAAHTELRAPPLSIILRQLSEAEEAFSQRARPDTRAALPYKPRAHRGARQRADAKSRTAARAATSTAAAARRPPKTGPQPGDVGTVTTASAPPRDDGAVDRRWSRKSLATTDDDNEPTTPSNSTGESTTIRRTSFEQSETRLAHRGGGGLPTKKT